MQASRTNSSSISDNGSRGLASNLIGFIRLQTFLVRYSSLTHQSRNV
nr:MAG TPA: hypothetical protein [Caudoviricetes sp.]